MHHSRLCAVLIDCRTSDLDGAARFWGEALGRLTDPNHPGSRGNYRMLETRPDEPIVQIQRVGQGGRTPRTLGGDGGADRPTLLRRKGTASRFSEECQPLGLKHSLAPGCTRGRTHVPG